MHARTLVRAIGRAGILLATAATSAQCASAPISQARPPIIASMGDHSQKSALPDWAALCEQNRHGDMVVTLSPSGIAACSCNPDLAEHALDQVLQLAVAKTTRGCMVAVRGADAAKILVPLALTHGFKFHSADKEQVIMRYFRSDCEAAVAHGCDPMPDAAFTSVATSGVVINRYGEVLLIRQTYDPKVEWRLPGGATDRDESLMEGAKREVFEETGVCVEPVGVLGVRQAPRYSTIFGKAFIGATGLFELGNNWKKEGGRDSSRPELSWPKDEIIEARWIPIAQALLPPIPDGGDAAEEGSGMGVKEFESVAQRARAFSDAVQGGMTSSQFQRACVIRGAVIRGFGSMIPASAVDDAVAFGALTAEQAVEIKRGESKLRILREATVKDGRHATGTPSAQARWVMHWP